MYDTITKDNYQHHTPLFNVKIIDDIDQVMREEQTETNNFTVDMFSPQRKNSDILINEVANLAIKGIKNDIINRVANLTISNVENNIINKVENLKINGIGNDSDKATESGVQVQFEGDSDGIYNQKLLSGQMIGIRQEEVCTMLFCRELGKCSCRKGSTDEYL